MASRMPPRILTLSGGWWRAEPTYNIAIATGAVSGVFVVDVDGLDAEAELRKLEAEHGELPPSVEVITARGGTFISKRRRYQCATRPAR
jgi:hypothetical protein